MIKGPNEIVSILEENDACILELKVSDKVKTARYLLFYRVEVIYWLPVELIFLVHEKLDDTIYMLHEAFSL